MKKAKFERVVLWGVAIIFIPLMLFTGMQSVRSFQEEQLFLDAANLTGRQDAALNGTFGRVTGKLEITPLNPKEWPEVKDALEWAVFKQTYKTMHWTRDKDFQKLQDQVPEIRIAGMPVKLSRSAQYFLEMKTAYREINAGERYVIRWVSPPETEISAFGVYQDGQLQEGSFERLIIVPAGTEQRWVSELAQGGLMKGYILGGVALLLALLTAACAFLAVGTRQKAATA